MKSRWGSCIRNKGKITLNLKLIHTPIDCIDYVVLHELMHFVNKNHDKAFYNLIEKHMPEWKNFKMLLNGINL